MIRSIATLFDDYMPHGMCYAWQPEVLWLNVGADVGISLAYFSIPVALLVFFRRRHRELPFPGIFLMFAGFIVACGLTHLMAVWNVWHGDYGAAGLVKAATAAISVATAFVLVRLMPAALELRTPTELDAINRELESRIAEDERKTLALARSLDEKEILLREIHHRVKNNLQIISGLLQLQAAEVDDGLTREKLDDCRRRVRAMALVHDQLYVQDDNRSVRFAEYARNLVSNLVTAFGPAAPSVFVEADPESIELPLDQAIPCGLLINELVSNSMKHAFPDGRDGSIVVSLATAATIDDSSSACLRVRDDGIGLPAEMPKHGLGLRLVKSLASQLGGTVEIAAGGLADFRIQFDYADAASRGKRVPAVFGSTGREKP